LANRILPSTRHQANNLNGIDNTDDRGNMLQSSYHRYWGKAGEGATFHSLPYHSLDVAAVGKVFLQHNGCVRQTLADLLGTSETMLVHWAVFFLGLHDIGKFSRHFQALRPDLFEALQGDRTELPYVRHDVLGELLWQNTLHPHCLERGLLDVTGGRRRPCYDTAADYWLHTVLGHHGKPVSARDPSVREIADVYFPEATKEAVKRFFDDWHRLFEHTNGGSLPAPEKVHTASWWLAGLAVLCDWLGSNQEYFPFVAEPMPLEAYWTLALQRAEEAIKRSGLTPAPPARYREPVKLFGSRFKEPTPLQALCLSLPLEPGAGFYLLEDVTGAGKTEAALILTHRLMAHQKQRGVYFALPTMATANAMFQRMGEVYRRLYVSDTAPSLVLAHGARRLHRGFRDAIENYPSAGEATYGDGTEPAQFRCAAWLADNPKKSLLAEVGVGTIDQAVLGILPSRHQSLRLLGLLGKVLILDEVHAYDAYLFRLLRTLITFHTRAGGSTILLSATLPSDQRQALLNAYYEGLDQQSITVRNTGERDYPLLTQASARDLSETVLASRPEVCRRVDINRIDTEEQAHALISQAVEQGHCICWIRNTVQDAREAWRELNTRHPEWHVDLFHARYALGDRLTIEDRVVTRFGKNGGEIERKGQVLIATQVVEQSLDIDFDHMITDLAPIDLIIQRAGRLKRHKRDGAGNPIEGPDQRDAPVLHLYAPEPVDEPAERWLSSFLPRASFVYPNHARLWLGLRLLVAQGGFSMPDDARTLIEGVYGDADMPTGLQATDISSTGAQSSEASLADYNAFRITAHYGETEGGRWWSEERAPTRLGDSLPVYLGRLEGDTIVPLHQDGDFPWHLSSVSILSSKITNAPRPEPLTEEQWARALEQLPAKGRWGVLVVLDSNGLGAAVNGRGEDVQVRYCEQEGLLVGDEYTH